MSSAFDLSSAQLIVGQKFGVVGRHETHMQKNDLIPFKPSPLILQTPGIRNAWNWLSVKENRHVIIFLVYSDNKIIFDHDVWPLYGLSGHRSAVMKDAFLTYVLHNLVDILIIGGTSAANSCKPLTTIFEPDILSEVQSVPSPDNAQTLLSIARCGVTFTPKTLDAFKPDRPR